MNLQQEAYGPTGNPACHQTLKDLQEAWSRLPVQGQDVGRLVLICQRQPDGTRLSPDEAELDVDEGLVGDGWARRPPRQAEAQIAVINHQVAQLLANGQPVTHSGDNLYVDLNLSAANLPTGTRLSVGEAELLVSPKPHNGCAKFHERFGADALRFVQAPDTRDQNLRGIYWQVTQPGRIWQGAPIEVTSRPA